jgi:hypothetical protein
MPLLTPPNSTREVNHVTLSQIEIRFPLFRKGLVERTTARTRRPNRHRGLAQADELESIFEAALFIIIAANLS